MTTNITTTNHAISRGTVWFSQTWWGGDTLASRQYTLLRILAVSYRERLDVVPLIYLLASEHRGFYRSVLNILAARIESGISLVSALEQTPDALSDEDVLALRLAGESGTWAQTFDGLLAMRLEDQQGLRIRPKFSITYWIVLLFISYFLIALMLNVVMPTFLKIGDEFGMAAPRAFLKLRSFNLLGFGWLLLLIIVLSIWISWFRTPRRFFLRQVAPKVLPAVARQQLVELYRLLAIALDAGRPLSGAISTLARCHFSRRIRERLLFARNEVEQGADQWQSLAQSKLISRAEADLLAHAPNPQVAAWSLRELARKKLVLATRRTAGVAYLIEPIITLCFGAMVMWVCIAFFQYLVAFIGGWRDES